MKILKITFVAVLSLMLILGAIYLVGCKEQTQDQEQAQVQEQVQKQEKTSKIAIIIPEDIEAYEKAMTEYIQTGERENPADIMPFTQEVLEINSTEDLMKASANAAAEVIKLNGGPEQASISYFEFQDNTAYVVLNIDDDGWPGVSVSIAKIHPLIEKTLLEFNDVDSVVFGRAPERK